LRPVFPDELKVAAIAIASTGFVVAASTTRRRDFHGGRDKVGEEKRRVVSTKRALIFFLVSRGCGHG
jgi:hypothetical protein